MRVGVLGINHKLADLKLRDSLAKACQKRFGLSPFAQSEYPFVLLSTCNRTEIYFTSNDLAQTHTYFLSILRQEVEETFEHKLYAYFGQDCFTHLVRVSSGLDSAILAETEIQGQVKTAYLSKLQTTTLPNELHFLFQKGLKASKDIRTELQLGRGMPSLEHAVFNIGMHFFKDVKEYNILFVGASEINQKILEHMKGKELANITICNRSSQVAQDIAQKYALNHLPWENLSDWHRFDWIIFGTKSPDFLIKKDSCPSDMNGHKLIVDLCVPRNVEPSLSRDKRITLLNIDQIIRTLQFRKKHLQRSLTIAEEMISTSGQRYLDLFRNKEHSKLQAIGA